MNATELQNYVILWYYSFFKFLLHQLQMLQGKKVQINNLVWLYICLKLHYTPNTVSALLDIKQGS